MNIFAERSDKGYSTVFSDGSGKGPGELDKWCSMERGFYVAAFGLVSVDGPSTLSPLPRGNATDALPDSSTSRLSRSKQHVSSRPALKHWVSTRAPGAPRTSSKSSPRVAGPGQT